MIPKIIHQIWYQGEKECPEKYQNGISSWKKNHTDWQYMFWDEWKMDKIVKTEYAPYYKRWKGFNYMHQRIDFFKYILMDKYGGIYADIDTTCLKKLDPLLQYRGIVISKMTETFLPSILGDLNNGIIMSEKGHPFWRLYMNKIVKQKGPWFSKFTEIENTTGPTFFSKCVWKYKEPLTGVKISPTGTKDDITILGHDTFEPCAGADPYCKPGKDSYVNHVHAQTWVNPGLQWISQAFYYIKGNLWLALFFVIVIIFLINYFFLKFF